MKRPCKIFLNWNSITKSFWYYDKVTQKEIEITNPVKFYPFAMYHTIRGFSKEHQRSIWANEVKSLKDILNIQTGVKDNNDNYIDIYNGTYNKETKLEIEALGAHYILSVYAITANGAYVNFQLRKEQVATFIGLNRSKGVQMNQWVSIYKASERTFIQNDTESTYYVPLFKNIEPVSNVSERDIVKIRIKHFTYMKEYFRNS